ncbi:MAG: lamin tail domain-containing protein, partial [Bacteroidota bacterium]
MKKTLTYLSIFILMIVGWNAASAQCSELFFSEYIEGSSNNKAIEVFNPTSGDVDLSNYTIYRYGNGSATPTDTLELNGILAAGDVYIAANSSADSIILAVADTTAGFPGVVTFNGDDAMGLYNETTAIVVDVIGEIGVDPGSNWPVGTGSTANFTLVRMIGIQEGSTDWTTGANEWDVFPQNTYDSLGTHNMTPCAIVGPDVCSELFFSEYIEGSSNNKAIEVFNPTAGDVDLSDYTIYRYGNGSPVPTDTLELSGILAAGDVYIAANSSADPVIIAAADTTVGFPGVITFNGDDAMGLYKNSTATLVDVIGEIGNDPGSNWPVGSGSTANFTLVRMASIQAGSLDWTTGANEWIVLPQNTYDSLGTHTMVPCSCLELFFSEYIEGSSNNKAIEVFNPTSGDVDLSNYTIYRYGNGSSTPTDTLELAGLLASNDVYVAANSSADSIVLAQADTTVGFPGVITFNGDDAMGLYNEALDAVVDVIGEIGVDPGSNWPVGTGSTANFTLVRMASIQVGSTDWTTGANEWDVFPQNTYDSLGAHYMIPCGTVIAPSDPTVSVSPTTLTVNEGDGTAPFAITIMDADSSMDVDVYLSLDVANSTATLGSDFTWSDTVLTFTTPGF